MDPELDDIQHQLSIPVDAIPGQMGRRRFLQGILAAGAATALVPSCAAVLQQLAADNVLVVVQLAGGNDGLNMVGPMSGHADYGRFKSARGADALSDALPLAGGFGLNPAMPRLKARWDAGQVGIVQGVGQDQLDLDHFAGTERWMAGTSGTSRTTGWLGRWLDGVPDTTDGLGAVHIGARIPLHLRGQTTAVTGLDRNPSLFGAHSSQPFNPPVFDAVTAMGQGTTGRGRLTDLVADTGATSIALAQRLTPAFDNPLTTGVLVPQLELAARLINADLGIRVLSVYHGSYDRHSGLTYTHGRLLDELDIGLEQLFTTLTPAQRDRVTVMTFSEFGRRVKTNASHGTDHGAASAQLVIGTKVKGGLHGAHPPLADLDTYGNLKTQVDHRSYYASILDGWLGGGSRTVLGRTYEDLHLFRSA